MPQSEKVSPFSEKFGDYKLSGRRLLPVDSSDSNDSPLVLAIHGGTYSSAYFDLDGYSLLVKAATLGIPAIAIDRPGYGETDPLEPALADVEHNAERLDLIIGNMLEGFAKAKNGVVLIGHSIGGAVALSIAARNPSWPLCGVAVSGVGLTTPPESGAAWAALPDIPMIELPSEVKDQVMFGPEGSFKDDMPALSHKADAPVPRLELIDITSNWSDIVLDVLNKIQVPVHYRQAEFDRLWNTGSHQIEKFAAALTNAPDVDALEYKGVGHCIDFHRAGAAFQFEQLAFALKCSARTIS